MTRRSPLLGFIRRVSFAASVGAVLLFGGCQAIFTYSPLAGLQQDPSNMSPDQRLEYAKDALASGDTAAMKKAYDAIVKDTGADAVYTTAQLGIEISGVPDVLVQIAEDPSGDMKAQLGDINAYITAHNLDPVYMVAAAHQLQVIEQIDPSRLTHMDRAMGAIGLMLGDAKATSGTWDIKDGNITLLGKNTALGFLQPAHDETINSSDAEAQFVNALYDYINGLTP